jgi:hypothetical protein
MFDTVHSNHRRFVLALSLLVGLTGACDQPVEPATEFRDETLPNECPAPPPSAGDENIIATLVPALEPGSNSLLRVIDGYQDVVLEQINATTDDGALWYRAHDPEQLFEIMLLSEHEQPILVEDKDKAELKVYRNAECKVYEVASDECRNHQNTGRSTQTITYQENHCEAGEGFCVEEDAIRTIVHKWSLHDCKGNLVRTSTYAKMWSCPNPTP